VKLKEGNFQYLLFTKFLINYLKNFWIPFLLFMTKRKVYPKKQILLEYQKAKNYLSFIEEGMIWNWRNILLEEFIPFVSRRLSLRNNIM